MPTTFTAIFETISSCSEADLHDATDCIIAESTLLRADADGFYAKIISAKMIDSNCFSCRFEAVFELRPDEFWDEDTGEITEVDPTITETNAFNIARNTQFLTNRWYVDYDESYRIHIEVIKVKL